MNIRENEVFQEKMDLYRWTKLTKLHNHEIIG